MLPAQGARRRARLLEASLEAVSRLMEGRFPPLCRPFPSSLKTFPASWRAVSRLWKEAVCRPLQGRFPPSTRPFPGPPIGKPLRRARAGDGDPPATLRPGRRDGGPDAHCSRAGPAVSESGSEEACGAPGRRARARAPPARPGRRVRVGPGTRRDPGRVGRVAGVAGDLGLAPGPASSTRILAEADSAEQEPSPSRPSRSRRLGGAVRGGPEAGSAPHRASARLASAAGSRHGYRFESSLLR